MPKGMGYVGRVSICFRLCMTLAILFIDEWVSMLSSKISSGLHVISFVFQVFP